VKTLLKKNLKKLKFFDILIIISGAFVIFCYLIYFSAMLKQGMYTSAILPVVVISMVVVPIVFSSFFKHLLKKLFKPAKIIFCIGMCFYMITFSIFCGVILLHDETVDTTQSDGSETVIIVFGCYTNGWYPSQTLKNRLDRAYKLLDSMPESICIVSGGQGDNESVRESTSMKAYLENQGIDGNRIYEETKATDTIGNISYSLDIIDELNIDNPRIICVSSEFHTARIYLLAQRFGFKAETASAPSPKGWLLSNLVREYMAYIKIFIVGSD